MVYLYSVENVITLGKLIGLLFCLPSSLFFFVENSKNTRNELRARACNLYHPYPSERLRFSYCTYGMMSSFRFRYSLGDRLGCFSCAI